RLPRIKFRRRQRQRAARVWRDHERHGGGALRWMVAGDRHRARGYRSIDEACTIGLAACERKKQVARFHRAAVDGKSRDVKRLLLRIDPGVNAKKVAKSHSQGPAGRGDRLSSAAGVAYWVVFDAARMRRSDGGRSKRGSTP